MAYFPMYINLSNRKCVVIGGGSVALRKVQTLLKFDAEIKVIAPEICEPLRSLLSEEHFCQKETERADIKDAALVIAATDCREVNRSVAMWCHEEEIPVNVIDEPAECTFLFPSVVKRGDICIGINTAGQSPIVSKKIRQEVEKAVPEEYTEIARQLGQVKRYVKEHISKESERRNVLKEVAGRAFEKGRALNSDELQECLGEINDV